ncbi:hypothetical protein CAL7716_057000 [Calothrix sp. PCC 7716]|nr:hypothetical protein CAL7716_057000 [Calothrix sp. PCC 7716]
MDKALRCFRHSQFEEIIEASDVDFNNLNDLIVKCLCCKEFVDWVAANKGDAIRTRQAHFRHQNSRNKSFTSTCEKRVAQFKGAKLSAQISKLAESRNRFIRREFWRIVRHWFEKSNDFQITHILENVAPIHRQIGVQLAESFRHYQDNWHPQVDEIFGALT